MGQRNRLRSERAQHQRPLWFWPLVSGVVSLVCAVALNRVPVSREGWWKAVAWPGDAQSAAGLVQVVAGSVITVTTLTFSLTVVALQLASQQFSPRLLREFTRDPVTRLVLSVLVGTFVLSTTVLREIRADEPPPALALIVVHIMGLAALGALLAFITHMVRALRVDTMMVTVHDEANRAIRKFYRRYDDEPPRSPAELAAVTETDGATVTASSSGFVQLVDVAGLVDGAARHKAVVRLDVRPGDHVVRGSPVATCWAEGGGRPSRLSELEGVVRATVTLSYERTLEQDAAFGLRQLEDIAVKALSPGINDPVTAAHAIGHLADLLVLLAQSRLGPTLHGDSRGTGRAVVPDRDLRYYLDLACGQVRRYGREEPTVLVALLRLLREVATAAQDDRQRAEVVRQTRLILATASDSMLEQDRAEVEDMARRVEQALGGDLGAAYGDRSGETRSM